MKKPDHPRPSKLLSPTSSRKGSIGANADVESGIFGATKALMAGSSPKHSEVRKNSKIQNGTNHSSSSSGNVDDDIFGLLISLEDLANIPPGLEAFVGVTKASVAATLSLPVGTETVAKFSRKYSVRDQSGEAMYYAAENVNAVSELLCQGFRPFRFELFDFQGEPVMRIQQKCNTVMACFQAECAGSRVDVLLRNGKRLGSVNQTFSCCTPVYEVIDEHSKRSMTIVGQYGGVCFICQAKPFRVFADILRHEETVTELIATIGRRLVNYKEEMNVEMKALLLAAVFLLEMDYYRSCRGLRKVVLIVVLVLTGIIAYRFSPYFHKVT